MSLAEMWRVIRRRWYVLVPSILLALGLTAGVYTSIPKQYQSSAMMSLLASQQSIKGTSTVPGTSNPFMNFDSSLNDTADFLVRRLTSTDASTQLASEGVGGYTAALAASAGPFIQLTATGSSKSGATASIRAVISYAEQQLKLLQQQQGVPARAMIESAVIVPGSPPTALTKRRTQDTLGAGVAALALALLLTFAVDALAARRRPNRRRPAAPAAGAEVPAGPFPEHGTGTGTGTGTGMGVRRRSDVPGELGAEFTGDLFSPLSDVRD